MGIFGLFSKKSESSDEATKSAEAKAEFANLYDEVMAEMRESKAQASLAAEQRANFAEPISTSPQNTSAVQRKEFAVTGYVKYPERDYEPVTLTGGRQIREILGCTEGVKSVQVHTKKGYSVYANSEFHI